MVPGTTIVVILMPLNLLSVSLSCYMECSTVSLEVKDVMNGFSLVKQTGTYSSKKDETNGRSGYYGFDVMFDQPICLEASKARFL